MQHFCIYVDIFLCLCFSSMYFLFVCLFTEEGSCVCVSHVVMSDSLRPHGVWPARLLCPWDSQARIL